LRLSFLFSLPFTFLSSISEILDNLIKYFKSKRKKAKKESENRRKESERERKEERESQLEEKKVKGKSGGLLPSAPRMSFMDRIMNFFTSILIGSLLKFLLKNSATIFKIFDDIASGINNIWDVIRIGIISLTTVFRKQIRSLLKLGKSITKGPAKLAGKLLKKLGVSLKNLLVAVGKFVTNKIKQVAGLITGAPTTRGSRAPKRVDPSKAKGKPTARKPIKPAKPGTPKPTSKPTINRAKNLFGNKGVKRLAKVSKVFKRIPFVGALIGIGIDMAMGEPLDNAVAGAAGASLGSSIGSGVGTLVFPGLGTLAGAVLGGIVGDWAGKEIYKQLKAKVFEIKPPEEELDTPSTPSSTPSPGTTPLSLGYAGSGAPGQLYTSNASVTWYDPGLGGINSGTGKRDPNAITSTGEPYQASAFTAAAFPPFLSSLPLNMTTKSLYNPSGRTLASGQQFNVLVTNKKTGKSAILRVNDVGSGVGPASKQTKWLDFSVAAKNYLGTGSGFEIRMAPAGSTPGPLNLNQVKRIRNMGASAPANASSSYTVSGITYDTATGKPIDFPGQRTSTPLLKQSQLPPLPPTNTIPGKQHYGAHRKGGRKHAGVDFDISGNEKFYSRIGGVVTKVANDPGGYGKYVDIYNEKLKRTERIAEGARVLVKKGDIVRPGQPVVQGESETGVIHYEIRKGSGYGFSGTEDPTKFLASLDQKGGVTASTQAQSIATQASYDQQGGTVVVPISTPSSQGSMIGSGGFMPLPIGMSKKALLNSYYQTQLTGFLYKQG
jgi:murein DD-endopeptidase MepM/ murein hydrolase activator NlpD